MNLKHNLTPLLTKHFGYSEFRENQHEIINSILQNENTVAERIKCSDGIGRYTSLEN